MRVLVIGGGAREHALARRLRADPGLSDLVCAPGNPGISLLARLLPGDVSRPGGLSALADFAARERIDLTIVGPEVPLSFGIVDRFVAAGLAIFGPTAAAARLESSKAFAKAFMARHDVPSARFRLADSADEALATIESGEFAFPVVLKADGLAAGKGVVVAQTRFEAGNAIAAAMTDRRFGGAGARLVIEECMTGPEVSFFAVCDGARALPIGTAQDHKRMFDEDLGPNTGGMGAFAPSPLVDSALHARVMREIVEPVIAGLAAEGHPFRGFLYAGLMLTSSGPKVIEFNVRLGDPEAQVVLPLIDEPFLPMLAAAASGNLRQTTCRLSAEKLVGVVLASRGYPESFESDQLIDGLAQAESIPGVHVLHAGTATRDGRIVTSGGRVLTVVGRGADFPEAITRAYAGVSQISFDGMQYRRDIGRKALQSSDLSRSSKSSKSSNPQILKSSNPQILKSSN
ncbi:MAG: phosphoribosylamine--glycine ligase [Acidobacteria bacterium RIFCSPLOWO2_02_FULL_65_29]|nr:MAG: phosphoribosylamine--glycine ligase [Acidobacteria bacterium RIFCSPLOWO2_02_FULL_65_29]